jgi:hypothetical protein
MDWEKAENHLIEIRQQYNDIGSSGIPALSMFINPLLIRFEQGERTENLYNSIMNLE